MSADLFSLAGRTALVTGANTGLGQAIAVALAGAGADIVAVGRSAPDETRAQVSALKRRFEWIGVDFAKREQVRDLAMRVKDVTGRLDILINNAGTIRRADAIDYSESDWDEVLEVNLTAPFLLAQSAARIMLGAGGGKIVNVASMLSFQGGVRVPAYTASKSAIAGLTRALANEWAAKGVNVNAIAPGYFATNNTEALRADENRSRDILSRIPAGRWGAPDELAGAAIFLASRAADYVHGAILPVDGGWLAR
jgi:2-deoxy-D-gluconate 3-dehydrogenase